MLFKVYHNEGCIICLAQKFAKLYVYSYSKKELIFTIECRTLQYSKTLIYRVSRFTVPKLVLQKVRFMCKLM